MSRTYKLTMTRALLVLPLLSHSSQGLPAETASFRGSHPTRFQYINVGLPPLR